MFFDELSNDEWVRLSALVSDEPAVRLNRRGRPRAEPRIVANAVLWILSTGEPWSKLPGRYPSGPTCRRRFEEWQMNGTLLEMVRLLSETGRTFAYIPEPAPPVASKPVPEVEPPKPRDETMRGVFWKSPESWQTAVGADGVPAASGVTNGWRPLGAMADITRQLAGMVDAESVAHEIVSTRAGAHDDDSFAVHEVREPRSAPDTHDTHAPQPSNDGLDEALDHARAEARQDGAPAGEPHHPVSDERAHDDRDEYHAPLWMNLAAPGGEQFDDARGYMIYVVAEAVATSTYRASAEIMKDGRRVERSGLIGPRFDDEEAARRFALQWAIEWIERMSGPGASGPYDGLDDAAQPGPMWPMAEPPVSRLMPDSAATKNALPAGNRPNSGMSGATNSGTTTSSGANGATSSGASGSVNSSGSAGQQASAPLSHPQHANAHRVQLRRYPSESGSDNSKSADRIPLVRKLLSHVR